MPRMGITGYDLLISCPGDVDHYIDVIRDCVEDFNKMLGRVNNVEITTKHWSTDSYPQSGGKPQELLNKQFIRDCDAAIAIFWTKFGTATDRYGSGTEEEIEEMLSSNKQVFMYFLDTPINTSTVNVEQYNKVTEFKEKYKDRGIYVVIKDENELRRQFTNHLAMHFLPLVSGQKTISDKMNSPILKVRDAILPEYTKAIVSHSNFSGCKLIIEKAEGIISKIASLQKEFLPQRENNKIEEINTDYAIATNINFKKLMESTQLISGTLSDLDIPDHWKVTITEFASKNELEIETPFWNVGDLKKRDSSISSLTGRGTSFEGSDEEEKRYKTIQDLYWEIKEYEEYSTFFNAIDCQGFVKLVLTNIGTTFDEDIDVKLTVKKGCILEIKNIPVPEINIINDILKMKFLRYTYEIENSDTIDRYMGYPLNVPNFDYEALNSFKRISIQEEYKKYKRQYKEELDSIFCYERFSKDDCDIFTFHISYLKHNTSMAFPSVLILNEIPESIEFEITSKFIATVVKEKLIIKCEN